VESGVCGFRHGDDGIVHRVVDDEQRQNGEGVDQRIFQGPEGVHAPDWGWSGECGGSTGGCRKRRATEGEARGGVAGNAGFSEAAGARAVQRHGRGFPDRPAGNGGGDVLRDWQRQSDGGGDTPAAGAGAGTGADAESDCGGRAHGRAAVPERGSGKRIRQLGTVGGSGERGPSSATHVRDRGVASRGGAGVRGPEAAEFGRRGGSEESPGVGGGEVVMAGSRGPFNAESSELVCQGHLSTGRDEGT